MVVLLSTTNGKIINMPWPSSFVVCSPNNQLFSAIIRHRSLCKVWWDCSEAIVPNTILPRRMFYSFKTKCTINSLRVPYIDCPLGIPQDHSWAYSRSIGYGPYPGWLKEDRGTSIKLIFLLLLCLNYFCIGCTAVNWRGVWWAGV
jgi:hypothetical protein